MDLKVKTFKTPLFWACEMGSPVVTCDGPPVNAPRGNLSVSLSNQGFLGLYLLTCFSPLC